MKTNRLFLALAFVAVLGGSSAFAQNTDGENNKPADKQRKRPTPEQMMEFQTKRMDDEGIPRTPKERKGCQGSQKERTHRRRHHEGSGRPHGQTAEDA